MPLKKSGPALRLPERPLYSLHFAKGNALIEREFDTKNLGICRPTVKEKIKAEIVNAYAANDMDRARRAKDQLEKILQRERAKRLQRKQREANIARLRQEMNYHAQSADPNSDGDDES